MTRGHGLRSESFVKKIRRDDPNQLAIPDWDFVAEAIKAREGDEALNFLEFIRGQSQANNDNLVSFVETVLTHLASFGEDEILRVLRPRYLAKMTEFLSTTQGLEEELQRCTAAQRRHHADFTVTEEPDRYVVTYDPCGSGGRLRRTRSVGTTQKAYPWSWGKAGVPYYCCHCCVSWEIIVTELRGYPVKITLVGERPEDPCVHLFYKKPELIPEEYFARIGMKKDMASFEM